MPCAHLAVGALGLEVGDRDFVARIDAQVFGGPGVEHDLVVGQWFDRIALGRFEGAQRRLGAKVDGRDRGVGDLFFAGGDRVGQIGEDVLRLVVGERAMDGAGGRGADEHAVAGGLRVAGLVDRDVDAVVGQRGVERLLQRIVACFGWRGVRLTGDEDGVDLLRLFDGALQRFCGDECVERQPLAGMQREAAQAFGRQNGRDGEPAIANGFGLAPQGAVGRNLALAAHAHQHFVADLGADLVGQRPIEHHLAAVGRFLGAPVAQRPEALVAADDGHLACAERAIGAGMFDGALHDDGGHGLAEAFVEAGRGGHFVGELRGRNGR